MGRGGGRGCSVHQRDIIIHVGGYHDSCGWISWVHWGVFSTSEGYHEYIEGTSWFIWESKLIKAFDLYWKPQCTEHAPMYSWYPPTWIIIPPTCIMVTLRQCTHGILRCTEQQEGGHPGKTMLYLTGSVLIVVYLKISLYHVIPSSW